MPLLYGIHAQQDNPADNKPHILSFGTARTTAHATLFEIWNGDAVADIMFAVDLNGKMYSNALTAGDMLYAVAGGVSNVRRLDSVGAGDAYEFLLLNGTGVVPEWTDVFGGAGYRFDGGISLGNPTGGLKGAGTINCKNDIYKDNAAYTSPDAVLEKHFTGKVEIHKDSDFADYPGLMPLLQVEAFAKANYQLPRVGSAKGIFRRGDVILEKVEEAFLYLFDHERRIREMEQGAA